MKYFALLLVLVPLLACGKSKHHDNNDDVHEPLLPPIPPVNQMPDLKMECSRAGNFFLRCENSEVVCYVLGSRNMNCKFK
jgi:hypothetical protein